MYELLFLNKISSSSSCSLVHPARFVCPLVCIPVIMEAISVLDASELTRLDLLSERRGDSKIYAPPIIPLEKLSQHLQPSSLIVIWLSPKNRPTNLEIRL